MREGSSSLLACRGKSLVDSGVPSRPDAPAASAQQIARSARAEPPAASRCEVARYLRAGTQFSRLRRLRGNPQPSAERRVDAALASRGQRRLASASGETSVRSASDRYGRLRPLPRRYVPAVCAFDFVAFRDAFLARDVDRWLSFYAPEAEWLEYRDANPPCAPNVMCGVDEIRRFLQEVAASPIKLAIENEVVDDQRAAFTLTVTFRGRAAHHREHHR